MRSLLNMSVFQQTVLVAETHLAEGLIIIIIMYFQTSEVKEVTVGWPGR
jgi:hypothetical protein